ncbi:MAG: potassium transporter KefC [Gammaproteobacteria bacterium]|mgnify:FL=1|nr:potassium transporter KefC [Gammaproteobacteria bacterium]
MAHDYLLDLTLLLFAAVIVVPLSQWVRLGAVPGFLIAGGVVGPSGVGWITNSTEIGHFAEIGVVLLLFVIGIELKPALLWRIRRLVFGLGSAQVLVTGVLLVAVSHLLFEVPLKASILIGLALALSSTAFVLQLLKENRSLTSVYGRSSFAILLLQDLAVVPLLALVPLLAMPELSIGANIGLAVAESLLILGGGIVVGRYLLHPLLHRIALSRSSEIFTATAVLIVIGTALVTEYIGLSMAMGAFMAGLLLSSSPYKHQVMAEIHPLRGLLLGLFFMSMGMSLNLGLLLAQPLLTLGLVGLLILIKIIALYPIARLYGVKANHSAAIALVLAQSGEFALVLFSLAYQAELFDNILFEQLLLVVLLSMLATPLLAYWAQKQAKRQQNCVACTEEAPVEPPVAAPIILIGFGRVGQRIGEVLKMAGHAFVALDSSAASVERERSKGAPVYYGDAHNPELLKAAGVKEATAIIVTINSPKSTEELVAYLRSEYPQTKLYARGHSIEQCITLRKMGVTDAVSENIEASLELARMALEDTDLEEKESKMVVEAYRRRYHSEMRGEVVTENP